jgi:hypothetical protein
MSGKGWSIVGKDQNAWATRRLQAPGCALRPDGSRG